MSARLFLLLALLGVPLVAVPELAPATQPAADRHDEPLPDGAIARLGTARLHGPGVGSVLACSDDGTLIASGKSKEGITVWDAHTGRRVARDPMHVQEDIGSLDWTDIVSLSFSPDRRFLAVGCIETGSRTPAGMVRIWSLAAWREESVLYLQAALPTFVAFLPDSRHLLVVTDKDIRIFARPAREVERTWGTSRMAESTYGAAALTPDGRVLAVVEAWNNRPEVLRVWDVASGEELFRTNLGAEALAFRQDGQILAAFVGSEVHLLEALTGNLLARWPSQAPRLGAHRELTFSLDGTFLVAGCYLHDATTGEMLRQLGDSVEEPVGQAAFPPIGRHLIVSRPQARRVEIQDILSGRLVLPSDADSSMVAQMASVPGSKNFATVSPEGTVRLWNPRTGTVSRRFELSGTPTLAGENHLLIRTGERVAVCELETGKVLHRLSLHPQLTPWELSADGRTLLALSGRGFPKILDATTGRERCQVDVGTDRWLNWALDPQGKVLAGSREEGVLQLWDATTGKLRFTLEPVPEEPVYVGDYLLVFTPDGQSLLSCAGRIPRLRVWDVTSGRLLRESEEIQHPSRTREENEACTLTHLTISPDGRMVVTSLRGPTNNTSPTPETTHVWEFTTLQERLSWPEQLSWWSRHNAGSRLAFADRGRLLVSDSEEAGTVVRDPRALARREYAGRPSELSALWDDLAGEAGPGYRAIRELVAVPDRAVPMLTRHLRPVRAPDSAQLRRLIGDLDADEFDTREKATAELTSASLLAEPALREALKSPRSAEQRQRLEELLTRLDESFPRKGMPSSQQLRAFRAIEALEEIATPEARVLLERLAGGEPAAEETIQARAALERLRGQP
jgi:WD40 repeat protein